ncbi:exo-beta-N-acetylmuramidase NamZ family protein [Saccharicrinis sp. 156]|uniref:exo-beta-N-acetylmuramidase NamZ family protein n=1 Tax=Saccharicrinis sp. 156 TaxID=3417574 RepID=UPI003D35120E
MDKKVGLLVNHSSLVEGTHLLDTLLSKRINVIKIFAPEHGFRGKHDAGERVKSDTDSKTGLPIVSLYGKNKKPGKEHLADVDIIVFDIQDVGVRFYTYISSMHYMMEACAETATKILVLDRPNPNGDYFDGPILKPDYKSFVGMHPLPVVHGLTVGELAQMINGEGWLTEGLKCDLHVVKVKNWNHSTPYDLPVKPSPNLPNYTSIRLYPSLCFFEASNVSVGRGTYFPFQVIGYPDSTAGEFTFTPRSIDGMSKHPKQQDKKCYGIDLRREPLTHRFTLSYFISFYKQFGQDERFGLNKRWFNLLAGDDQLIKDIRAGLSEEEIKRSWKPDLEEYSKLREKYLLYGIEYN